MSITGKELDVAEAVRLGKTLALTAVHTTGLRAVPKGSNDGSGKYGWKLLPIKLGWGMIESELRVAVPITLAVLRDTDKGPQRIADLGVLFRLDYSGVDPEEAEKAIASYIGITGLMHIWPYARAEIQQLSTKIGLPPLLLPPIVSGHCHELIESVSRLPDSASDSPRVAMSPEPSPKPKKAKSAKRTSKRLASG